MTTNPLVRTSNLTIHDSRKVGGRWMPACGMKVRGWVSVVDADVFLAETGEALKVTCKHCAAA